MQSAHRRKGFQIIHEIRSDYPRWRKNSYNSETTKTTQLEVTLLGSVLGVQCLCGGRRPGRASKVLRDQDEEGGGALADFRTRCEAPAVGAVCCGEVLGKQIDAAERRARGWTHTHTAD